MARNSLFVMKMPLHRSTN